MNDRIFEALSKAGLSTSPLGTLDHASARASTFFALYDEELVYFEAGHTSRVPLRDVTRIHSDREGVLRVETSERTAVTASLLGYDPGRVQAFFQQVRDVTARAKELPVLPLNQTKVEPAVNTLTGSSIPAAGVAGVGMPGASAYTPAPPAASPATPPAAQAAQPTPSPAQPTVQSTGSAAPPVQPDLSKSIIRPVEPPQPATGSPAMAAPGSISTASAPIRVQMPEPTNRPEPVIISSMPPVSSPPPFQERAGERARQTARPTEVPAVAPTPAPVMAAPASLEASEASAHSQGPMVSVPVAGTERPNPGQPSTDLTAATGPASELIRRAETVQGFARTVGLLAVVLGLAALALAYFQWQNGTTLSAIWTVLTGGVGTVALLAFAEALRLLGALARGSQPRQG